MLLPTCAKECSMEEAQPLEDGDDGDLTPTQREFLKKTRALEAITDGGE
jgi:hypothetical protein